MKLKNLLLMGVMLIATSAVAQENCTFFFPNQEGQQVTRNCYTANGNDFLEHFYYSFFEVFIR